MTEGDVDGDGKEEIWVSDKSSFFICQEAHVKLQVKVVG
jgi:hypothetical protein